MNCARIQAFMPIVDPIDLVQQDGRKGAQMGSSRMDRDIAKLRKNSQNVNRQIWLRNFA